MSYGNTIRIRTSRQIRLFLYRVTFLISRSLHFHLCQQLDKWSTRLASREIYGIENSFHRFFTMLGECWLKCARVITLPQMRFRSTSLPKSIKPAEWTFLLFKNNQTYFLFFFQVGVKKYRLFYIFNAAFCRVAQTSVKEITPIGKPAVSITQERW